MVPDDEEDPEEMIPEEDEPAEQPNLEEQAPGEGQDQNKSKRRKLRKQSGKCTTTELME
jgi:hypothetical protein